MQRCRSLLLVLVVAAAPPLLAQGEAGIKGGVSVGDISNKALLPGSLARRTGVAAGVHAAYHRGLVGVGMEMLYSQRGVQSDQASATAPLKLDFVDLPIYIKVAAPPPGFSPFVYAGPQLSLRARCRTASGTECAAVDSTLTRTDFSGVVGAGLRFRGIAIEARYVYGLRNLLSGLAGGPPGTESYRTRSFLILGSIGRY